MPRIEQKIDEIRRDTVRGAAEIAIDALTVLKEAVEIFSEDDREKFISYIKSTGKGLANAQPHMSVIRHGIGSIIAELHEQGLAVRDVPTIKNFVCKSIDNLVYGSKENLRKIREHVYEIVESNKYHRLMTHSYSSTVVSVLYELAEKSYEFEVLLTESKVSDKHFGSIINEKLLKKKIRTRVVPDVLAGYETRRADAVIVGADSVLRDCSLINGAGTYHVAMAAYDAKVPFYVVCESSKFDPLHDFDTAEGIGRVGHEFDVTPSKFIQYVVTEHGLQSQDSINEYMKTLEKYLKALE